MPGLPSPIHMRTAIALNETGSDDVFLLFYYCSALILGSIVEIKLIQLSAGHHQSCEPKMN
jgi:hypothetical protein